VLAHQAIEGISVLRSAIARRERLPPLAAALQAQLSRDTKELAGMARQIAATRISLRRHLISLTDTGFTEYGRRTPADRLLPSVK
jgi:hypothetical protein